jgi:type II secretory pathway pseudopilin PulG
MSRTRGLTLVEMLIIVIVLAILAAVVTPQLGRASGDSRLDAMRANLLDIRAQLRLYQSQHGGKFPSLGEFVTQMTQYSNAAGQTSATRTGTYNLGPYVLAVPGNPYTGGNRIGNGQPGTSDWFYDPATGLFRANHNAALVKF